MKSGELFFECAGEGDTVVLLHGFSLDLRMWTPQFEEFQKAHRVIRYDLRGFGRSTLPLDVSYSHEDDWRALMEHLGAKTAHVVGLSMGGRMALRFALAYPEMVSSLVLADSGLDGFAWSEDWQTRWNGICECTKAGRVGEGKRLWLEHPLLESARTDSACAALLSKMVDDYSGLHWAGKDAARVPTPPIAERLREIRSPSLVITGSRDIPDFQAIATLLVQELPNARREIIEGSGHMVNLEATDRFNKILEGFWRGLKKQ
jgi:3-oxoadipate enol-lactonase